MKAALLTEKGFIIKDVQKPRIGKTEALIRVKSVGICGTDLAIYKGTYKFPLPRILGHEIAGEIAEIGSNKSKFNIGDRVTTEINITCGKCYYCMHGLKTHCINRKALGITEDGGFAEYVKVPIINLHKIPDNITYNQATFIEPLAASIQAFRLTPIKEKESFVVVYGTGKMGLLEIQVAKILGAAKVIAIGRSDSQLKLARKLGADVTINSTKEDPIQRVKDETEGLGADITVECTGNPEVINKAIKMTRNRGTVALKSTHGIFVNIDITQIVVREMNLQGSRCGEFPPAIEMLKNKQVKVDSLISAEYSLDKIEEAFQFAMKRGVIKVIIHP